MVGPARQVKLRYPGLPLVFASAVHDVTVALACLRCGALDYLRKPFERQDLSVMIRRAFDHDRLRKNTSSIKTSLQYLVAARTAELRVKLSTIDLSNEETVISTLGMRGDHPCSYWSQHLAMFRALGLHAGEIESLTRAAWLHHVGQVPALLNILLRPECLSPDELELVCKQCYEVHEIFQSVPCLAEASEIMFASYERFDSAGHPRELKGDEIPPLARILGAVYSVFETAFSTYPRMSRSSMCAEIQRWSGSRFDPEVLKNVLSTPEETWAKLL
jgi:response regulator RpfG family c-di-GMP phosphodiesterase